tara:strand:- start:2764 stop:2952 length:189 start_codon:yes stop_codon:yes gene_type:complete
MVSIDWSEPDDVYTTTGWLMEETIESFVIATVRDYCMSDGQFECFIRVPKAHVTELCWGLLN